MSSLAPFGARLAAAALVVAAPFLLAAEGDGCAASSRSAAPDVAGLWDIAYDDSIDVEIRIGGAVYVETLSASGGVVTLDHDGTELSFDLDCARPEILCPSEAWPGSVRVEQRETQFEHRMIVTLPTQSCAGELVQPSADECGVGTLNFDCEPICDGELQVSEVERFGVIGEAGDSFRLYLGAGIATNGINCALLAVSLADASLVTTGADATDDWRAIEMSAGLVTIGYGGTCLWAGDPDMDAELEALVGAASVTFRTGFSGVRSPGA